MLRYLTSVCTLVTHPSLQGYFPFWFKKKTAMYVILTLFKGTQRRRISPAHSQNHVFFLLDIIIIWLLFSSGSLLLKFTISNHSLQTVISKINDEEKGENYLVIDAVSTSHTLFYKNNKNKNKELKFKQFFFHGNNKT